MRRHFILVLLLATLNSVRAQSENSLEQRLEALVQRLDLNIEPSTQKDWLDLLKVATDSNQPKHDRSQNLVTFYKLLYDEMGAADGAIQRFKMTSLAFAAINGDAQLLESRPLNKKVTANNELGGVKKVGNGPKSLILIPPLGYGAAIFDSFMTANQDRYTMYAITLPGFGGTDAYQPPTKLHPSKLTWTSGVSKAIQRLMANEKITQAFIGGVLDGFLMAGHFATQYPESVTGLISFEGYLTSSFLFPKEIGQNISQDQRKTLIDHTFPVFEIALGTIEDRIPKHKFTSDYLKNTPFVNNISKENTSLYAYEVFYSEFTTIDLTQALKDLNIPILVIASNGDSYGSRNIVKPTIFKWQKFMAMNPHLEIMFRPMDMVGALPFLEYPLQVNTVVHRFINKGWEENQKIGTPLMPSPRAAVSQVLGTTEVSISYHRPAAKGREIWGGMVPYGRVWRAGANGATSFRLNRDVLINDQPLKKGNYDFFVIPNENTWTIIFNQLSGQWGSFNYDPSFDALRVDITPEKAESFTENLKYDLDLKDPETLVMSLAWGDVKGTFEIKEQFQPPAIPIKVQNIVWQQILEDPKEDGVSKSLSDAKSMSYYFDAPSDSIWFRFDLYNDPNPKAMALNVLVDTDQDQSTGLKWFGKHNRKYTFEKMISVWLRREGDGYHGVIGVTDQIGQWTKLNQDNITHYLDLPNKAYIIGMKRSDIHPDLNHFNLIGAVGEFMTYNDTISNQDFATINLKR